MANLLSRFKKDAVGSREKDSIHDDKLQPSGDFTKHQGINAILTSWKKILRTRLRTADHDPEYGTKLHEYIFEPQDNETKEKIIDEVKNTLMKFDDRATISKINVLFSRNRKGFILDITVRYNDDERDIKVKFDENTV